MLKMNCNRGDIMNERMNKGELEKLISTLKIEKGEYWIVNTIFKKPIMQMRAYPVCVFSEERNTLQLKKYKFS